MKLSKLFVINTNYKTVFNYFKDLGAFWVQLFWGVIYYLLRLTAITDRGDRIRTCDLVLPKHSHQQGYN